MRTRRTVSQATKKLLPFRFEQEPLAADSPFRFLPNVILTSHSASVSKRSLDLLQIQAPKLPAISCRARGRQGRWSRDQPQCGWWTPCQHRRNDCMPYSSRCSEQGCHSHWNCWRHPPCDRRTIRRRGARRSAASSQNRPFGVIRSRWTTKSGQSSLCLPALRGRPKVVTGLLYDSVPCRRQWLERDIPFH